MYQAGRLIGRFILLVAIRVRAIGEQHVRQRAGGYLLAMTHQGHLDPVLASALNPRPVRWMARKEFYHGRFRPWLLETLGAFRVNRQGIAVGSVRTAIELARQGQIVGICPEGEVCSGMASAIRGGGIKRGVCSIAIRAQVPIVPCVLLGADRLNCVRPWLPTKSARLWVAYGEAIVPRTLKSTRAARTELAGELGRAYVALYAQLRETFAIDDRDVP
jgi:1-acyl-sn-glycerol-3-phosphate acyltransferase